MVRAQDAFAGGQGLLVQGDRLIEAARVPVGDGEVVARGQGVGMVRAPDAFLVSYQPLVEHDGLRRAVAEIARR